MGCRHWIAITVLLLGTTMLISYDTMEVVVYVEPGTEVTAPAEFVARQACGVLQALDLPLPTPYRLQWHKQLANGAALPDDGKVVTGMLTPGNCSGI